MFTTHDDGFIIAGSIFVGNGDYPSSASLILRLQQWDDVVYSTQKYIIDYPGEYELSWYIVLAWSDSQWLMNYSIRYGNKKVAFIQSSEGLENDLLGKMDTWFVNKPSLIDLIAMRELEGEVVLLGE